MRLLLVLVVAACNAAPPPIGAACGCENRGATSRAGDGSPLVCERIRTRLADGGVDFPACVDIGCCVWELPL